MDWRQHISVDPVVCHGQACIEGTRIPVAIVLDNLAAGLTPEEILASHPPLRIDDVRAATACAAGLARERIVEIGRRGAACGSRSTRACRARSAICCSAPATTRSASACRG
jgi:uncharacterized protein (DUF433 family)